jgi:hypothetical protein
MKVAEQDITKVFVIESLREGDRSTGTSILSEIKKYDNNIISKYYNMNRKEDLSYYLSSIASELQGHDGIILFIEVHGSMDGIDIGTDKVSWAELTDDLKKINEACMMGLVVVFSCCYGVYYFRETSITGRSPYYVMFGVDKSIYDNRLLDANKILVKGFLDNKSLKEIEAECNSYLHLHNINLTYLEAGEIFVNAFHNYISNECKPENLDVKSRDCYKLLKESSSPPYMKFKEFKTLYIRFILNRENNEEKYNQIRERFLMTDLDGSLYQRFHVDFDEMYEKTYMSEKLQDIFEKFGS